MKGNDTEIPMQLTVGKVPLEGPESGAEAAIIGPELTAEMLTYLDRHWTAEERLQQLGEIETHAQFGEGSAHATAGNSRVHRAYSLHRAKHSMASIALSMGVSIRTAQRLVRAGQHFVAPDEWRQDPADDVRLAWLRVHAPDVFTVLELREYGYRQEQIAEIQHISVDRVEYLASRGREVLGDGYWRTVRRRHQVRADDREEVSTEEIAERMREREAATKESDPDAGSGSESENVSARLILPGDTPHTP